MDSAFITQPQSWSKITESKHGASGGDASSENEVEFAVDLLGPNFELFEVKMM